MRSRIITIKSRITNLAQRIIGDLLLNDGNTLKDIKDYILDLAINIDREETNELRAALKKEAELKGMFNEDKIKTVKIETPSTGGDVAKGAVAGAVVGATVGAVAGVGVATAATLSTVTVVGVIVSGPPGWIFGIFALLGIGYGAVIGANEGSKSTITTKKEVVDKAITWKDIKKKYPYFLLYNKVKNKIETNKYFKNYLKKTIAFLNNNEFFNKIVIFCNNILRDDLGIIFIDNQHQQFKGDM